MKGILHACDLRVTTAQTFTVSNKNQWYRITSIYASAFRRSSIIASILYCIRKVKFQDNIESKGYCSIFVQRRAGGIPMVWPENLLKFILFTWWVSDLIAIISVRHLSFIRNFRQLCSAVLLYIVLFRVLGNSLFN